MESRNKAEAERMIREQHQMRGKPEDAETRRDTVGRELHNHAINDDKVDGETKPRLESLEGDGHEGKGSVIGSSDDAMLPDPDAGGAGERGPAAYGQRGGMEGPVEAKIRRSHVYSPNDDMAGEGWTVPEQKDEGWVQPQEPALEERMESEDRPEPRER